MAILIFLIISYVLLSISLYLLFPKAEKKSINGLIPGVNFIDWCTLIGRPKWWAALLLLPVVNLFIYAGMAIDMVRSFGYHGFWHSVGAVIYAPAFFWYISRNKDAKFTGPVVIQEKEYLTKGKAALKAGKEAEFLKANKNSPFRKSPGREWVESIIFAVFAAAFIRMFLIEAFVIPTPSMEGSLKVGDFLFVSKSSFGIRTPETILMIPLLHNRIPILNKESYIKKPNIPSVRLPALREIQRNKPFVFNWPAGDSVYLTSARSYSVNQVRLSYGGYAAFDRELIKKVESKEIITRPIDKKDHYIKRCVALPGDTLEIRNREMFINGIAQPFPKKVQFNYIFNTSGPININERKLAEWGIGEKSDFWSDATNRGYVLDLEQAEKLKSLDPNIILTIAGHPKDPLNLFPHDPDHFPDWSIDRYGPIWIPKKGTTVPINKSNIALYKRIIGTYEGNSLEMKEDEILINGEVKEEYTFKQDYYWAMGDNRHNSEDSRMWGFVPHDHIVGRPLLIWFSTKDGSIGNGIRWDRIFKSANVD